MNRLIVRYIAACVFIMPLGASVIPLDAAAREIALTFDDAPTPDSALMSGAERTAKLIAALRNADVADALFFVKTDYINPQTTTRLKHYTQAGFHLANHSHRHLSANELGVEGYTTDAQKAHSHLKPFENLLMYHRFPYLHYGKDLTAANKLQESLADLGYSDGYVTVDNFDWYINALLVKAADEGKTIDYARARDFYVSTLYEAVEFYDALAKKTLGYSPRHVLLLHENDAAALFVADLVRHLRSKGWKIISPQQAYEDKIAEKFPQTAFQKQGRIAAIASAKGIPEAELRHISESTDYLDKAFLNAEIIID